MNARRKSPLWKNILFSLAALLVFLIFCDATLRIANKVYFSEEYAKTGKAYRDSLNFWKLLDKKEIKRGKPFAVVVGDSITYGYRLNSFRNSYPYRLDEDFRRAAGGDGIRLKIVMDAKQGGNTIHEWYSLRAIVNRRPIEHDNPSFAVIGFCLNDAMPEFDNGVPGIVKRTGAARGKNDIVSLTKSYYETDPKIVEEGFAKIGELSRKRNFPVLVVIFPYFTDLNAYPLAGAHKKVAGMARAEGLMVLDLLPVYRGIPEYALRAKFDDAIHPSPLGNKIAADAIFAAALKNEWIKGLHSDGFKSEILTPSAESPSVLCDELYRRESMFGKLGCERAARKTSLLSKIILWKPAVED